MIGFASRPEYGRTKPVRVLLEAPDGTECEAYLKGPHFAEKPFPYLLEREWFSGRLACQLKLPCAYPLKVRLTPEVIASEPDAAFRSKLQNGPEILFASLSGGSGWIDWNDSMNVARSELPTAAKIYLFDTIIQNWDRCLPNPNLLAKGEKFLMIDHGEAFVTATGSAAERDHQGVPWALNGVNNHFGEFEMHPLWPKLRPKKHVDFGAAASCWKALPVDTFALIAADVPDCWDKQAASRIAAYLTDAVENIEAIVRNIEYNFDR